MCVTEKIFAWELSAYRPRIKLCEVMRTPWGSYRVRKDERSWNYIQRDSNTSGKKEEGQPRRLNSRRIRRHNTEAGPQEEEIGKGEGPREATLLSR